MLVLIDGDPPVYSCGFAANEEDVSHALHNMKKLIEKICRETNADEYKIFLTGKNNYRDELVDYYKANRNPAHKPVHYEALRNYLVEKHEAEVVNGMEADDMLGVCQYQARLRGQDTCIATIDKDMNMIPGWHYNWNKETLYNVSEEEGIKFFYTQLLTGDPVDNIKGVPGIGPKRAAKILDGTEAEYWLYNKCLSRYRAHYGREDGENMLEENAHLLWIRRHPDEMWRKPEHPVHSAIKAFGTHSGFTIVEDEE